MDLKILSPSSTIDAVVSGLLKSFVGKTAEKGRIDKLLRRCRLFIGYDLE